MKQLCVFIVDDEPRIVKFLKLRLQASGYKVLIASNGLEALEDVEPSLEAAGASETALDGLSKTH